MNKATPEVVFQVGFIVNDLDEIIENLKKYFNIDEASINIKSTDDPVAPMKAEYRYNGEPCDIHYRRARLNFGGIDFEYIEPLNKEGGDPYSDWLIKHGPGINHLNMKLDDRSAIDKAMEEEGRKPLVESIMGPGMVLEAYDFTDKFGFIAELGDMVVGPMADAYYKDKEK